MSRRPSSNLVSLLMPSRSSSEGQEREDVPSSPEDMQQSTSYTTKKVTFPVTPHSPDSPGSWFQDKTTMIKVPSQRTIRQLSEILEKSSTSHLSESLKSLSNPYDEQQGREDIIFEMFQIPGRQDASIGKLLTVLKGLGLRKDDPRLKETMTKLRSYENAQEELTCEMKEPKHWKLTKEQFVDCISPSIQLITLALQNDLVIPCWPVFVEKIREIYVKCKDVTEGEVATYIPQLARADPHKFGVSVCTVDGQRASFGDCKIPFCVQSVSKAFNYGIAASDLGTDYVHSFVGQEPSGRLFNEICLDPKNKPHNPMVNSGAIVVTSLIKNNWNMADRFDYVLTQYRRIAGGEYVGFNNATFLSERSSADRNYALAYFMKENKCFPAEVASLTDALDFYFQLCSLEATCETMSVMASTLANGGVCPITGKRCIAPGPCRDVLSLMYSCGMYDASGQFSFMVGLPAKSGVSGILIVVVPNVMGIALWSPPLDKMGNSCRGVAFCRELVSQFNFHNYDCLLHTETTKFDPRRRDTRERDKFVPVLFAARAGDMAAIRRLYMHGADLSVSDYDQRTALHVAACEGHVEVVRFLVNVAKVDVHAKDRWGRTALTDCKFFDRETCANFLEQIIQHEKKEQTETDDQKQNGFPSDSSSTISDNLLDEEEDAGEYDGIDSLYNKATFSISEELE